MKCKLVKLYTFEVVKWQIVDDLFRFIGSNISCIIFAIVSVLKNALHEKISKATTTYITALDSAARFQNHFDKSQTATGARDLNIWMSPRARLDSAEVRA